MKKLLLFVVAIFALVVTESCNKCKDVNCGTGGTCEDGECVCSAGFSGDNCQIEDLCISNNVQCENDGECEDGECKCPRYYKGEFCEDYCENGKYKKADANCECYPGWEGSGCNKESREPWISNYLYTSNCNQTGGTAQVDTLPHPDPDSAFAKNYVRVENLSSLGDTKGYGIIEGDSLYIPRQGVTAANGDKFRVESLKAAALDGNGNFNLVIERTFTQSGGVVVCTHTYSRL